MGVECVNDRVKNRVYPLVFDGDQKQDCGLGDEERRASAKKSDQEGEYGWEFCAQLRTCVFTCGNDLIFETVLSLLSGRRALLFWLIVCFFWPAYHRGFGVPAISHNFTSKF